MAGRRPKPTQLKILEGNRGHRPIVGDDLQPPVGAPEMPKRMSRLARREFRFMCRVLVPQGLLTVADGRALAAYCEACASAQEALSHIKKYGQLIPVPPIDRKTGKVKLDAGGKPVVERFRKNPSVGIYKDACRLMLSYMTEFGLTPASRQRLNIVPKIPSKTAEELEFEKLMQRRPVQFRPNVTKSKE